ncbi:hypothetical protein [Chitinolyticbacter albus]|uniref:hypothetical protein n=1 Tax=Chitinolyticbacter albus TaxID=2961951 RepID=UPI002109B2BA|nr:hypothetical protein [Chitinolyticbacter albus]
MRHLAMLLLVCAPCANADDWGRLFFDAPARREIDNGKTLATVTAPPARSHRFDGELRRNGQVIRFIDGEPAGTRSIPQGTRVGEQWQEHPP